jgi:hypothetical protein
MNWYKLNLILTKKLGPNFHIIGRKKCRIITDTLALTMIGQKLEPTALFLLLHGPVLEQLLAGLKMVPRIGPQVTVVAQD